MLTRRLLVPLVAVPFAFGTVLAGSASAATPSAAPATGFVALVEQPDAVAAQATVKIVKGKWSKNALTAGYVKPGVRCTKAKSIAITNTTAVKQPFSLAGKVVGIVPPHKTSVGCLVASGPATGTLKLNKSGDTLKVTVR